jgi:dihydroorotase
VHISSIGLTPFPLTELPIIDYADVDACARTLATNPDIAIGIKVRMSEAVIGNLGLEPLKRAIAACDKAGTGGKVMVHIGGVETSELMVQILEAMRPGDVLTHAYTGATNAKGALTNIVQEGAVIPAALSAKQRGVIRSRRGQLRLHRGRGGHPAGLHSGHHLLGYPRQLRQYSGNALPLVGHEQVPWPRLPFG